MSAEVDIDLDAERERLRKILVQLSIAKDPAHRTWRDVDHEIARWQAADSHTQMRIARTLIPLGHRVQRRVARVTAVEGWQAWLAALSEQVESEIWRVVLLPWSLWTGLAPPLEARGATTVQRK